jgi:ferric-dicitrate binding protein FerR (iron transport regulator)
MVNNQEDIESLIAGFLTNSLNEEELKVLNNWLSEDATHRKEFNRLRSCWIATGNENGRKSFDARRSWRTLETRIKPEKTRWIRQISPLWYAASLLVCFALGTVVATILSQHESAKHQTLATTIRTPLGAKSNITLPDGSSVWLNAGSEIAYSSDFGMINRDLQLTGEAFFEVKSDSLKPFNVIVSGMTVRALGTRFNVKAYPDDNMMAATLEEGIVDVLIQSSSGGKTSSHVQLKPKEQLVIQKTTKEIKASSPTTSSQSKETVKKITSSEPAIKDVILASNVETELSTSWKDRKWIIRDEPLALFVENLERRYNLRITFASEELKDYNFSGTFENETVEQILYALSLAAPVHYKFDKNNVVLNLNRENKDKFSKILKRR